MKKAGKQEEEEKESKAIRAQSEKSEGEMQPKWPELEQAEPEWVGSTQAGEARQPGPEGKAKKKLAQELMSTCEFIRLHLLHD